MTGTDVYKPLFGPLTIALMRHISTRGYTPTKNTFIHIYKMQHPS